ncbi:shikimate dehydrogenase family protein [Burkholderia sp. 3C]
MSFESSGAIDGDTRWVAIVADPVSQVQSPQLFNAHFARHGIHAVLVPAHVHPDELGVALDGLRAIRNLAGVVVTVPHKIEAARWVAQLTPRARAIGSINCIRRTGDGGWEGDNFDGEGFVAGLAAQRHEVAGTRALLVGAAGGAGIALADALAQRGAAAIDLFDIRSDAADALARRLAERYPQVAFAVGEPAANAAHRLVINASPVGMRAGDGVPIDLSAAAPDALVADLIMKPACTPLLAAAEARGLRTHPGRHLLEQAVAPMADWLGLIAREAA